VKTPLNPQRWKNDMVEIINEFLLLAGVLVLAGAFVWDI